MDEIKNILKEMIELEGETFESFINNNPECFDTSKPNYLYPRLCAFFEDRLDNEKIKVLLDDLGKILSGSIKDNLFSELTLIDKSQSLDDVYVEDFIKNLKDQESDDYHFQKLKSPYKTKGITIAMKTVEKWSLQNLAMEFGKYEHPYILAELANCYILGSEFIESFNYLYRGAKQITTFPNKYWNSEDSIIGTVNILRHLFNMVKDIEIKVKLYKLYYLHLTRLLHISKDKMTLSNCYINRASMCTDKFGINVLPLGVNCELLYISDLYYAHFCGQPEIPAIMTIDYYKKSLTMYQNASIFVNASGGYREIEDGSYGQIVEDKHLQSNFIAMEFLKDFKNQICSIERKEMNKIFQDLEKECHYSFKEFKDRVLQFKN